jgi:hypothetical protein
MKKSIQIWVSTLLFMGGAGLAAQTTAPVRPNPRPTQGRPDITSRKGGIIIGGAIGGAGGKFVPWGGFVDLSDVAPLPGASGNGKCAFNATYDEVNIGTAPTNPNYTNKLKVDESKSVTTQPYLSEGSHSLTLSLDDGNLVPESNEANNQFSFKYRLKCKAGTVPPNPSKAEVKVVSVDCAAGLKVRVHILINNPAGITSYHVWSTTGGNTPGDKTFMAPYPTHVDEFVDIAHLSPDPVNRQHQWGVKAEFPGGQPPILAFGLEPGPDKRCPGHYVPGRATGQ